MKRNTSILLAGLLLLSATLACGNAGQAPETVAPESTSIPAPTLYPTYTPYPTLVPQPTLEPTSIPEPTEAPRNGPSLADTQFVLGLDACVGGGASGPALSIFTAALDMDPLNLPAIRAGTAGLRTAAEQDRTCLNSLPYPDNAHLRDVQRLYGLGLDKVVLAMDYMLEFCETGDTKFLDLAADAMNDASLYLGQATEAMELFAASPVADLA